MLYLSFYITMKSVASKVEPQSMSVTISKIFFNDGVAGYSCIFATACSRFGLKKVTFRTGVQVFVEDEVLCKIKVIHSDDVTML